MNCCKLQKKIFYSLIIFFFLISKPTHSLEVEGFAKVIDGDTIIIDKKKIRLLGIDAPEIEQNCKKPWIQFNFITCLLYTSPSPRDIPLSRMPSSA